ncbi:MAG: hypothetical protein GY768_26200 [Planctomycetaceae bacterium]|nr:hypothetical protein [Planctomycetaceae bacterium]
MSGPVLMQTASSNLSVKRDKVRDLHNLGSQMLMVSTDRISTFDYVLPIGIPDKRRVLTQIIRSWFDPLSQENQPFFSPN